MRGEGSEPSKERQESPFFVELSILPRMQRKSGAKINLVSGLKYCDPSTKSEITSTEFKNVNSTSIYKIKQTFERFECSNEFSLAPHPLFSFLPR